MPVIIPDKEISLLTKGGKEYFLQWADFMYRCVRFNMPDSELYAATHCERVLLFALLIGENRFTGDSRALEILAHAAVFHDTCRFDEYLDTGHGARAATYYKNFCDNATDIHYYPEAEFLMRYHDRDDSEGKVAIKKTFGNSAVYVLQLYDVFKDADALDHWRLGHYGIDARFFRTDNARHLLDYAKKIVEETVPEELIQNIECLIKQLKLQNK